MFYFKSSFVLVFIAFYVELSIFEGELSRDLAFAPRDIEIRKMLIAHSGSSFAIGWRGKVTATGHGIEIFNSKSLSTF
jgi:hypothetical protein